MGYILFGKVGPRQRYFLHELRFWPTLGVAL